jgi:Family of unknown function (DUF5317)
MVLVEAVIFGFLLGLALGGNPANIARLPLRNTWLIFAALALQVIAFPSASMPWSVPDLTARILWLVSYALLLAGAFANRHLTGVTVMATGLLCNLAAILANGGHMPVLPSALKAEGKAYAVHFNSARSAHPHLGWLVDRWAVPSWLPLGNLFSVGDVLIALGAFAVIVAAMEPRLLDRLLRRGRRSSSTPTATPTAS